MVSRAFGKQIIFLVILVGLCIVLSLFVVSARRVIVEAPIYFATGEALDMAVLGGIFEADKDTTGLYNGEVKAVVVPHHLVASKSIATGIKAIASSSPRLIIVISPDHFANCPKLLCTTGGKYKTFFGDISVSSREVKELEKYSDVVEDSKLFRGEHGIYTILPFIKHYLPEAKVVPIVVSQQGRATERERSQVVELLKKILIRKDVALVISSDFSHYLSLEESNEMDFKTQKSFCSGNSQEILALKNPDQSDCPLCLWILEQEAKALRFWNPNIVSHTNSANLLHDTTAEKTTSHFTITLSESPQPGKCLKADEAKMPAEAKILVVGDMMFDRYIRQVIEKKGEDFIFSCLDPLLKSVDFALGNLEGPITENASVSKSSAIGTPENYRFTFPTGTAKMLFDHNIKIVNVGNNHIDNFGSDGVLSTAKYLQEAGVSYFGDIDGVGNLYRISDKDVKLSFVGYNQFGGSPADKIARIIFQEKAAGRIVIVYAHWGQEYSDSVAGLRSIATLFSQNGADAIIGSHPHVVLEHEYIGDTLVYYSLGNFIFDQYFNSNVTKGLALQLNISDRKIDAKEYLLTLKSDGRTCPNDLINVR